MKPLAYVILLLLFSMTELAAAEVSLEVTQPMIKQGESFIFTVKFTGDLENFVVLPEPDLSALISEFEIKKGRQTSFVEFENGSMEQGTKWEFSLKPRYAGNQTIAAIKLGSLQSNVVSIDVLASDQVGVSEPEHRFASPVQPKISPTQSPFSLDFSLVFFGGGLFLTVIFICMHQRQLLWHLFIRSIQHLQLKAKIMIRSHALYRACMANDEARARSSLINVMQLFIPLRSASTLGCIANYLESRKASRQLIVVVMQLDRQLYAKPVRQFCSGKVLWRHYKSEQKKLVSKIKVNKPLIPELYKR